MNLHGIRETFLFHHKGLNKTVPDLQHTTGKHQWNNEEIKEQNAKDCQNKFAWKMRSVNYKATQA
jgi:hypothetical protein